MRVVLADGTVLDTRDPDSRAAFARQRPELADGLAELGRTTRDDATLAERIRHKFRLKNTTGYSLNALVDFSDPVDILAHLMIGSEGTLGFISEITYLTGRGARAQGERADPVRPPRDRLQRGDAAEADAGRRGRAARPRIAALGAGQARHARGAARAAGRRRGAARRDARRDRGGAGAQDRGHRARLDGVPRWPTPLRFATDAAEAAALWNVRKGMFPAVGAMRPTGTTVIIEDVAFPIERLAEATLDLQRLLQQHGYPEAIIFGHALEGNLHFVFTQDFGSARRGRALQPLHGRDVRDGRRQLRRLAEGRARHRPQHGALRRAGMGRAGAGGDAAHQGAARSAGLAQPRRDPQRRPASRT